MSSGFNYSKWDRIEVSDDEKDAHPNIDSSLMIRIKREQRARREAEEQMKISQLRKIGTPEALKQIEEIIGKSKLHVDNICRVVDEKTIVNRSEPVPVSKPSGKSPAEDEDAAFEEFVDKHEYSISHYASLSSFEESESYLLDHWEILNEHACGWMLLQQLNLEMASERSAMLNVTRQYLMLRNILDLAAEAKKSQDARPMVKLFFKQVNGDPARKAVLESESANFAQQIINRAVQKKSQETTV